MRKILFVVICLFCVFCKVGSTPIAIIPKPVKMTVQEGNFVLTSTTKIVVDDVGMDNIVSELNTILDKFAGFTLTEVDQCKSNYIRFVRNKNILREEEYKLFVMKNHIIIEYSSPHGAFYAVQTLQQLLPIKDWGKIKDKLYIPCVEIEDFPQLGYRGYLLDVARHFMPYEYLKKTVDLIAFYKLNVFHLHLSDDQGWRFESKKYPLLQKKSAWRSETQWGHRTDIPVQFDGVRHGGYYTQEQLKELVAYAKKKYVTIVPEIDVPGHTHALLAAYPELGCVEDTTYEVSTVWGYDDNILCPRKETFDFLANLFDEVLDVFPSKYIHIGGDEVQKQRWERSEFCRRYMKSNSLSDVDGIMENFVAFMYDYLDKKGRKMIGWDEIIESKIPSGATVMSWRGEKGGIKAARQNHNVIMTPSAYMYLNFYNTNYRDTLEILANAHPLPLRKVYSYDPFPKDLSDDQKKHIIGLQSCLWTEYCKSTTNAEMLTYPRLCAMSEVAWTPQKLRNYDDFYERLKVNVGFLRMKQVVYSKLFLLYK